MPIRIEQHIPAPVVQPPTTYDIMGLTRDQAALIRDLIGKLSGDTNMEPVYRALYDHLPGQRDDYQFRARVFGIAANGTEALNMIYAHPLG